MNREIKLTVLGARGSIPVSGWEFARYGGATTCILLECADCRIYLDAGTGILRKPLLESGVPCHILLSHVHADHVLGLPMFPPMFSPNFNVTVWGANSLGRDIHSQFDCLMSPPLWPITSELFRAQTEYKSFTPGESLMLSPNVQVETLLVSHPGGCIAYKLTVWGKTLVFATDTELTEETAAAMEKFASDCDLLLLDAQYSDEEYKTHAGFGHSSLSQALCLIEKSAPRCALLIHHDPFRTDDTLDKAALSLPLGIGFAKEGMEVTL